MRLPSSFIIILIILLQTPLSIAGEIEFMAGAGSTTYDETPEANTSGLTTHLKYNFRRAESGWMLNYFGSGASFFVGEFGGGYVWKTRGEWFFESGLGASYSRIWGFGPLVLVGTGYRVSPVTFFNLSIIANSSAVRVIPYIGKSF